MPDEYDDLRAALGDEDDGDGYDDLRDALERPPPMGVRPGWERLKQHVVASSPMLQGRLPTAREVAKTTVRALVPGGGAAIAGIEEIGRLAGTQGQSSERARQTYEALTGRPWRSEGDFAAMAAENADLARDERRAQKPGAAAMTDELLEMKAAFPGALIQAGKGIATAGADVLAGEPLTGAERIAGGVSLVAGESLGSMARTAAAGGGLRPESPVGSALDAMAFHNIAGGAARAAQVARLREGLAGAQGAGVRGSMAGAAVRPAGESAAVRAARVGGGQVDQLRRPPSGSLLGEAWTEMDRIDPVSRAVRGVAGGMRQAGRQLGQRITGELPEAMVGGPLEPAARFVGVKDVPDDAADIMRRARFEAAGEAADLRREVLERLGPKSEDEYGLLATMMDAGRPLDELYDLADLQRRARTLFEAGETDPRWSAALGEVADEVGLDRLLADEGVLRQLEPILGDDALRKAEADARRLAMAQREADKATMRGEALDDELLERREIAAEGGRELRQEIAADASADALAGGPATREALERQKAELADVRADVRAKVRGAKGEAKQARRDMLAEARAGRVPRSRRDRYRLLAEGLELSGIDPGAVDAGRLFGRAGQRVADGDKAAGIRALEAVNEHLGLKDHHRVWDARVAWGKLTDGATTWREIDEAVEVMRRVPGFEKLNMDPKRAVSAYLTDELADASMDAARTVDEVKAAGAARVDKAVALRDATARGVKAIKDETQRVRGIDVAQDVGRQRMVGRIEKERTLVARRYKKAMRIVDRIEERQAARSIDRVVLTPDDELVRAAVRETSGPGGLPVLVLDDKPLQGTEAFLRGAGKDADALEAALREGRLRYAVPRTLKGEARQAAEDAAALANEALLPLQVDVARLGQDMAALGLIGDDAAKVGTRYLRAVYDPVQLKRWKRAEASRIFDAAMAKAALADDAAERARIIDDATTRARKYVGADASKFAKSRRGVVDGVGFGQTKRAFWKYSKTLDEQVARGRIDPRDLDVQLAGQLTEAVKTVTEHQTYSKLARTDHFLPQLPDEVIDRGKLVIRTLSDERVPVVEIDGRRFVQIPETTMGAADTPRWGALAGGWLDERVARQMSSMRPIAGRYWQRVLQATKFGLVPANVSSQMTIMIGNMLNALSAGGIGAQKKLAKAYASRVRLHRKGKKIDDVYAALDSVGLAEGQRMTADIDLLPSGQAKGLDALQPVIDEVAWAWKRRKVRAKGVGDEIVNFVRDAKRGSGEALAEGGRLDWVAAFYEAVMVDLYGVRGTFRNVFELQEAAARYTVAETELARIAKARGVKVADLLGDVKALEQARDFAFSIQLDYADVPDWVSTLRQSPMGFGVPFISYPFKATGQFLRLGAQHPVKARAVLAGWEAGYDASTAEERARRDYAPGYRRGFTLPIDGPWGKYDLNVRYWSPVAVLPLTELDIGAGGDDMGKTYVTTQVPPINALIEALTNYDAFFGREIATSDMEPMEQFALRLWHVVERGGLSGTLKAVFRKVVPAAKGEKDVRGRELSVLEALLSVSGVRLSKPQLDRLPRVETELRQQLGRIKRRYERKVERGKATEADRDQMKRETVRATMRAVYLLSIKGK